MENNNTDLEYAILGSGSKANSYLWYINNRIFIVDNGFSCREFERRMKTIGLNPNQIELIFLTHTHGDHIKGIDLLAQKYNIPVVAHEKIDFEFHFKHIHNKLDIIPDKQYQHKDFTFTAFNTSHDASYSLGYHFDFQGKKITLITDTGKISDKMFNFAIKSNLLFLEANYSKQMLTEGPYPQALKKRISGSKGHLSNEDAGLFMQELHINGGGDLEDIFLCHLSENNNHPDKVKKEIEDIYTGKIPWKICNRNEMVCSTGMMLNLLID
jgi:phosphoribosyl 1,2-cyclic phosphodiesterase